MWFRQSNLPKRHGWARRPGRSNPHVHVEGFDWERRGGTASHESRWSSGRGAIGSWCSNLQIWPPLFAQSCQKYIDLPRSNSMTPCQGGYCSLSSIPATPSTQCWTLEEFFEPTLCPLNDLILASCAAYGTSRETMTPSGVSCAVQRCQNSVRNPSRALM